VKKHRIAIELVSPRWCHLSRTSWGLLTSLSYGDYEIISNLIFPNEEDRSRINTYEEIEDREYERRLLEIVGRMRHWKTNLVNIHISLNHLICCYADIPVSNDTLRKLRQMCPKLKNLRLEEIDSELLMNTFNYLEELHIDNVRGVENLDFSIYQLDQNKFPSLEHLVFLGNSSISFECLDFLSKFPKLKFLDLSGTNIEDKELVTLLANCPAMETIELRNTAVTMSIRFVQDWFYSSKPMNRCREVDADLNLICDPDIWRYMLREGLGLCYGFINQCHECHEGEGPGYAIKVDSWTFVIEDDYWPEFRQFIEDEPCQNYALDIIGAQCWFKLYPGGGPFYFRD